MNNVVPFFYTGYKEFSYRPFFLDENFVPHYSFKVNEKTGILTLTNGILNPKKEAQYHLPNVNMIRTPNCALQCVRIFEVKVLTPNRKLKKLVRTNEEQISFAQRFDYGVQTQSVSPMAKTPVSTALKSAIKRLQSL